MIQMNLFTKQKQVHIHRKQSYDYQKGKMGGGINQEFGIIRSKLPYVNIKQINNQGLVYIIVNYTQYLLIKYNGKKTEQLYNLKYLCVQAFTNPRDTRH